MDVDCDGSQESPVNDGRCDRSVDTQSTTAFEDTIIGYNAGIKELNPYVHPYVVFGNDNEDHKSGFVFFNPEDYGIEPLSIIAVVCGNELVVHPFSFPHTKTLLFIIFPSPRKITYLTLDLWYMG